MKTSREPMMVEGAIYGVACILLSLAALEIPEIHSWLIAGTDPSTLLAFIRHNPDLEYLTTYVPMILAPLPGIFLIYSVHLLRRMALKPADEDLSIMALMGYALFLAISAAFLVYYSIWGMHDIESGRSRNQAIFELAASSRLTIGVFYFVIFWGAAMFASLSVCYLMRVRVALR